MTHADKRIQRLAAHALCGRVGAVQLWMSRFKRLQLFEQAVVLGVRNSGCIQHVVLMAVVVQLRSQLRNSGSGGGGRHRPAAGLTE